MTDVVKKLNELSKKEKETGLTEQEKELQFALRQQYREEFRANFKNQLDNTYVVDEKGNKTKLKQK